MWGSARHFPPHTEKAREFTLTGTPIPAMRWKDHYKYLGVLLGPDPEACLAGLETEFKESTKKLFQSPLADWMKLEAFKEFVMPKLDYVFRSTLAHRKWAMKLDRFVRTTVKQSLGLPSRVTDAFFYVPISKGGLGLRSIEDELGNQMVTQCIKILSSPCRSSFLGCHSAKEVRSDRRT